VDTHVFCKALLRRVTDIETAEIDSYSQGNAFFQSAGDGLHETPHGLAQYGLVDVGGGNDKNIIRLPGPDAREIQGSRRVSASDNSDITRVLAKRIHTSTAGLSTPTEA
jgi:hypothetical protein